MKIAWACPECGAKANAHGRGGAQKCRDRHRGEAQCSGFICNCEDETAAEHGQTFADPCETAECYHCGFLGTFPQKPKDLQAWEKKALEAGWSPPEKRAKELAGSSKVSS